MLSIDAIWCSKRGSTSQKHEAGDLFVNFAVIPGLLESVCVPLPLSVCDGV